MKKTFSQFCFSMICTYFRLFLRWDELMFVIPNCVCCVATGRYLIWCYEKNMQFLNEAYQELDILFNTDDD